MSKPVHRELDLWADVRMADVLRRLDGVSVVPLGSETATIALHDAADLRLVRSGVQLVRSRSDHGDLWDLTVEPSPFWHRDLGGVAVRWIDPATDAAPEPVLGLLRGATLTEVLVERTTSRGWSATRRPSRPADFPDAIAPPADQTDAAHPPIEAPEQSADVIVHDIAVLRGRRVAARRTNVQITGDGDLVAAIVSTLMDHGGQPAVAVSAAVEVLGSRTDRPVAPTTVEGSTTLRSLVRAAIGRSVTRLLANDVAVRLDLGDEAVHQARVATRRLRSDLRTLRPVLDERWVNVIDRELRWLAGLVGELREADVLRARIDSRVSELGSEDRSVGDELLAVIDAEREIAVDALHRAMSSRRYMRLLDGLVDAADEPRVVSTLCDPDDRSPAVVRDVVRQLVAVPWSELRKRARKAVKHGGGEPAELHELRIRTKRARYAGDVAGLVSADAARHAKRLAGVQDELGELHDAVVAEAWLRERSTRHGLAGAFVIGMICAAERAEIARRRESWVDAWERADGRKVTRWLDA